MLGYILTGLLYNYVRMDASHVTIGLPVGKRLLAMSIRDWRVEMKRFTGKSRCSASPAERADFMWAAHLMDLAMYRRCVGAFEMRLELYPASRVNSAIPRADHIHAVKAA